MTKPISSLRQRMIDDMTMRNLSPSTHETYIRAVAQFSAFHRRSPDKLGVVESPGGIAPPGAPRTVHEPLDSHGSRCSAVAIQQTPVDEEGWTGVTNTSQPVPRTFRLPAQSLELATRPASDIGIDPLQGGEPFPLATPSPRRGEGGVRGFGCTGKTPAPEPPHPRFASLARPLPSGER